METAKENKGRAPGEITWSFVVPNYNGEKVIGECIEAMLAAGESASTHGEIVVVDDASTDRSLSLLIPYKDKLTLVSLVENRGFSGAVNAGIKRASGRIIFLINNDVRVSSDLIDKAVGHFSDRDVFAVSFHAYD